MGMIVDTNVFIYFEKTNQGIDLSPWEQSESVFISAITASELLIGVNRADSERRRNRRSAFVEAVLAGVPVLEFAVATARIHAGIYSELARAGRMVGAHDLIIAATARQYDLSVLTDNVDEFSRVDGLHVIRFAP